MRNKPAEYRLCLPADMLVTETKKIFKKPDVEAIEAYCAERGNDVDARSFYDFYESKNWMVGRNKMKDWQAAIRTWENKKQQSKPNFAKHDNKRKYVQF